MPKADGSKIVKELNEKGEVSVTIANKKLTFVAEDLLIETAKGSRYFTVQEGDTTVVLDTELTPELIEEGYVRELVSKIQNMRKEAGFEVQDYIDVYYETDNKLAEVIKKYEKDIAADVLGRTINSGKGEGFTKELDINGLKVSITVKK